jgi:hypothetical protein
MLIEGVWAEIKVGGEHLRLFAEHNAQGVQARNPHQHTEERINAFTAGLGNLPARSNARGAPGARLPNTLWRQKY